MKEKLLNLLTEICPAVDFENETDLVDDGILESLDIVTIVTEIIAQFDIELNVEDLLPENFNTLEGMIRLIESRME